MPPLSLMIKPVSGSCDMACRYCFYRDVSAHREHQNYGVMTEETLERLVRRAFAYADSSISFAFQGGEPTLAGLAFYERVIAFQKRYNTRQIAVHNAIQTNGYVLDEEWGAFFSKNHFLVGVSLDGTQALHDQNRLDRAGKGTYERVMRNIRALQKHQVDLNILCVITQEAAAQSKEIFETLRGFHYLQFIPCIDDFNRQGSHTLTAEAYGEFLINIFDLYERAIYQGKYVSVRNFDNYISLFHGQEPELCGMRGVCGRYYLIEADGGVYPCDFYVLDQWLMGNINQENFLRLSKSLISERFIKESAEKHTSCEGCQWMKLCRGGCKRDCEPLVQGVRGQNRYCNGYQKFFAARIDRMRRLAASVQG